MILFFKENYENEIVNLVNYEHYFNSQIVSSEQQQ